MSPTPSPGLYFTHLLSLISSFSKYPSTCFVGGSTETSHGALGTDREVRSVPLPMCPQSDERDKQVNRQ